VVGKEKHDCIVCEAGSIQFLQDRADHIICAAHGPCIASEMFTDLYYIGQTGADPNLRRVIIF
jgi:hypothetical protein